MSQEKAKFIELSKHKKEETGLQYLKGENVVVFDNRTKEGRKENAPEFNFILKTDDTEISGGLWYYKNPKTGKHTFSTIIEGVKYALVKGERLFVIEKLPELKTK